MFARKAAKLSQVLATPRLDKLLNSGRVRRYALILFAVTVAIYGVVLARSHHWIEPGGRIVGRDFLAFYMAGDMVGQGRLDELYDPAAQEAYQRQFMQSIHPNWSGTYLYLNPPHYAWGMSLPASLGYGPSLILWWLLSAGSFAATASIWRRWLGAGRSTNAILMAVCMPAWFWAFAGGQNSFFSLLILTVFCSLLIARRDLCAGLVLALLAYKFQLMILPAAFVLLKCRWRAVAGLALGGCATVLLSVLTLGTSSIVHYLEFASNLGRLTLVEGFDVSKQHSWHGFFALLGNGWLTLGQIRILTVAASLLSLALLARIWRGTRTNGTPCCFELQLSALVVATLLTSPHLFHYDLLIATLPAILWCRAAKDPDIAEATAGIKTLLIIGFVWLAVWAVADVLRFQLTPLLLLAWLIVLRQAHEPRVRTV